MPHKICCEIIVDLAFLPKKTIFKKFVHKQITFDKLRVAIFDTTANTKHGFCGLIFSINGPTLTRLISRLIQYYLLDPQSTQLI